MDRVSDDQIKMLRQATQFLRSAAHAIRSDFQDLGLNPEDITPAPPAKDYALENEALLGLYQGDLRPLISLLRGGHKIRFEIAEALADTLEGNVDPAQGSGLVLQVSKHPSLPRSTSSDGHRDKRLWDEAVPTYDLAVKFGLLKAGQYDSAIYGAASELRVSTSTVENRIRAARKELKSLKLMDYDIGRNSLELLISEGRYMSYQEAKLYYERVGAPQEFLESLALDYPDLAEGDRS